MTPNTEKMRRYCPGCGEPWPWGEALPPGHENCLPHNVEYEARFLVKIGAWSWHRQPDGRVWIGLGTEFSRYLTADQWNEVVKAVGYDPPPNDGSGA